MKYSVLEKKYVPFLPIKLSYYNYIEKENKR